MLAERAGLDPRVVSGLGARLIPMSAGPVSSLITVWTLTKEAQGLFYLFASLVALRSLFELGAGTSVIQIAAHARERAGADAPLESAFVSTVNKWMLGMALIFGVIVAFGGSGFLAYQGHGDAATLIPWISYLAVSVLQFSSEGRWGLLQGADRVVEVNHLRLRNSIIQYGIQWTLLLTGTGLYAFAGAAAAAYIAQEITFRKQHPWLYARHEAQDPRRIKHFRSELLTLIKRASQTYLTGYFVFQIQQPICFHLLGAEGSVRLGFTQTIGAAFITLPSVWIAMNFPKMAHQVADDQVSEAKALFKARFLQTVFLSIGAVAVAWSATLALTHFARFKERLMDPASALLLFSALAVQTVALSMTYWPRAFKVEPFVRVAYLQMIVTPLLLWYLTSALGLRGVSLALLVSWVLGMAGITLISRRFWISNPAT